MKNITLIIIASLFFSTSAISQTLEADQTLRQLSLEHPLILPNDGLQNWQQKRELTKATSQQSDETPADLFSANSNFFLSTSIHYTTGWRQGQTQGFIIKSYDVAGNVIEEEHRKGDQDGINTPISRILQGFNEAGNLVQKTNQEWSLDDNNWRDIGRYEFSYNEYGQTLSFIRIAIENNVETIEYKSLKKYDLSGNRTKYESIRFSGQQISYGFRETCEYNFEGKPDNCTLFDYGKEIWTPTYQFRQFHEQSFGYTFINSIWEQGAWHQYKRGRIVDTDAENEEHLIWEIKRTNGLDWEPELYKITQLDQNGSVVEIRAQVFIPESLTWSNAYRESFSFNQQGQELEFIYYGGYANEWFPRELRKWTYDNKGNQTMAQWYTGYFSSSRGFFEIDYQTTSQYNDAGQLIEQDYFSLNDQNVLENSQRKLYQYDQNQLIVKQETLFWQDQRWVVSDSITYDYQSTVGTEPIESPSTSRFTLNHYPNPATETSNISFDLTQPADISLELYDLLGRRIKSIIERQLPAGGHSVQVELSDLPNGIYFYRLSAGGAVQSAKVLVMN